MRSFLILPHVLLPLLLAPARFSSAHPHSPYMFDHRGGKKRRLHNYRNLHRNGRTLDLHRHSLSSMRADEKCGTRDRTPGELENANKLATKWLERNHRKLQNEGDDPSWILFPVCFHVIRPTDDSNGDFLNATSLQQQLDALNTAYSAMSCCDTSEFWCEDGDCSIETGIRFEMGKVDKQGDLDIMAGTTQAVSDDYSCVTRTDNDAWYNASAGSIEEKTMMRTLRRGSNASVLNVYFRYYDILGSSSFPTDYLSAPDIDGCIINEDAIIGGAMKDYNQGKTLVHEVGHWLGLDHTFLGSCDAGENDGDAVLDTPAEKLPGRFCEVGRDTCPGGGADPVHNFMDYSDDRCIFKFTKWQLIRMMSMIETYRFGLVGRDDIRVMDGTTTKPIDLMLGEVQNYFLETAGDVAIECISESDNKGDVDMYIRVNEKPDISFETYDCASMQDSSSEEYCASNPNGTPATFWISLHAFTESKSVTLSCVTFDPYPIIDLALGTAADPISLQKGDVQIFALPTVLAKGTLTSCELRGFNGDADLYFRFGAAFLVGGTDADCYSTTDGSNELCTVKSSSDNATLFVTVSAFADFRRAFLACFNAVPGPLIYLVDGVQSEPISLLAYGAQSFLLQVEEGHNGIICSAFASNGDGDLHLRWGEDEYGELAEPYLNDCSTDTFGTPCKVSYPEHTPGEPYHEPNLNIIVYARSTLENLTVTCSSIPAETTVLMDGERSDPVHLSSLKKFHQYSLKVNRGATVTCTTNADETSTDTIGEVDLYVRFDEPADITTQRNWTCRSVTSSSTEICSVTNAANSSTLYATILAYGGLVRKATVMCTSSIFETASPSRLPQETMAPNIVPAPSAASKLGPQPYSTYLLQLWLLLQSLYLAF